MCPDLVFVCVLVFVHECMCAYVCICVHVCDPFLVQVSCDAWQPTMTVRYGMASVMAGDGVISRVGTNAKIWIQTFIVCIRRIFEYSDPILLWLIYVYNSVVQTLWFVSVDKTKKYLKRMRLVPPESSTICGGSNSSACSPKL